MPLTGEDVEALTTEQREGEGEQEFDVSDIDVQALAEEVYALLRRELVLERERRGWNQIW